MDRFETIYFADEYYSPIMSPPNNTINDTFINYYYARAKFAFVSLTFFYATRIYRSPLTIWNRNDLNTKKLMI